MPLYGLRWCAIILGELLPERWQHRLDSNAALGTWDEVRREQIGKARALVSQMAAWSVLILRERGPPRPARVHPSRRGPRGPRTLQRAQTAENRFMLSFSTKVARR